ncbi:MAG: metallophosphoesterase family protein [Anaerolineae bacterium]|nr:metallophosphoesterase family protein [Anaerolineae bacterium]
MSDRIAIFADTHANTLAAMAVLDDIEGQDVDAVWCLGDLIGRGPDPVGTLTMLHSVYQAQSPRDRRAWLLGNHEMMILGRILAGFFNNSVVGGNGELATAIAGRHRVALDTYARGARLMAFLDQLSPYAVEPPRPGVYVAHAHYSLREDGVVNEAKAYSQRVEAEAHTGAALRDLMGRLPDADSLRMIITAHTHVSGLWQWDPVHQRADAVPQHLTGIHTFTGLSARPIYINPGSVGFPRWPDDTPTYTVLTLTDDLESAEVEFRQVSYYRDELWVPGWYPALYREEIKRTSLLSTGSVDPC